MNFSITASQLYYEEYWKASAGPPPETDPLTERRVNLFLRSNGVGSRVLDVGCGSGRTCALLARQGKSVAGVDISLTALQKARAAVQNTQFVASAVDSGLPFADSSFDALLCCEVIEHLVDVARALAEMYRVLRPGGLLFLSAPYHGLFKNLALVSVHFDQHFDPLGDHLRFFSVRSLRHALRVTGFHVERTTYLGRFWPVWMNMVFYARKA